jgi:hypothetical protein
VLEVESDIKVPMYTHALDCAQDMTRDRKTLATCKKVHYEKYMCFLTGVQGFLNHPVHSMHKLQSQRVDKDA